VKKGWKSAIVEAICNVEYGKRVVRKKDAGTKYPVYGGGGETFRVDDYNREDRVVVARFGLSEQCTRRIGGRFFLNDSGLTLSPRYANELLPAFLDLWTLASNDIIYDLSRGTAQRNLDVDAFRQLQICYPSDLNEQRRIVAILDEAFEGIAAAKANAEQNLRNATEMLDGWRESLFQDAGNAYATQCRLGDLVRVQNGFAFKSGDYTDDGHFVVRIGNVQDGILVLDNPRFITLADERQDKFVLNEGDILVSLTGNIGRVAMVEAQHLPAVLNQRVARITMKTDAAIPAWVFRFLTSQAFRRRLQSAGHGAAQQNVSTKEIEAVPISLPSRKTQERHVEQSDHMHSAVEELQLAVTQRLAALDELKASLLHQAFTGAL
jgi:type I restriction enzyme S subunit